MSVSYSELLCRKAIQLTALTWFHIFFLVKPYIMKASLISGIFPNQKCSKISAVNHQMPQERSHNGFQSRFHDYNADSETTVSYTQGESVRIALP